MTAGSLPNAPSDSSDARDLLVQAEAALSASIHREAILRHELEHRVKNMLAITRSVFSRTMDNADSIEDARDHFQGRLDVLARYHGWLTAMPGSTLDLETMVWDELMVVAAGDQPRIEVKGLEVQLDFQVAEVIALALHELAINSIKYGVLGRAANDGRLLIEWKADGDEVQVEWRESGIPIVVSAPIASGFGRNFIEQGLPYQLGAKTDFMLVPGGLVCRMKFRTSNRASTDPV